jgi:hypothetical protein
VARAQQAGFRNAVRERDDPFGDYGSGPRSKTRAKPRTGKGGGTKNGNRRS